MLIMMLMLIIIIIIIVIMKRRAEEGTCLVSADQTWPERNGSINAEARVELLTDDVTPTSHHYVTGSAPPPRAWTRDLSDWRLLVDGEVGGARNFTMAELQSFNHVTRRYVLECAGITRLFVLL